MGSGLRFFDSHSPALKYSLFILTISLFSSWCLRTFNRAASYLRLTETLLKPVTSDSNLTLAPSCRPVRMRSSFKADWGQTCNSAFSSSKM